MCLKSVALRTTKGSIGFFRKPSAIEANSFAGADNLHSTYQVLAYDPSLKIEEDRKTPQIKARMKAAE
jgi:hypothetical protein